MDYLSDLQFWLAILIGIVFGIPIAKCMHAGMSEPWQKIMDYKKED